MEIDVQPLDYVLGPRIVFAVVGAEPKRRLYLHGAAPVTSHPVECDHLPVRCGIIGLIQIVLDDLQIKIHCCQYSAQAETGQACFWRLLAPLPLIPFLRRGRVMTATITSANVSG